MTPYIIGTEGKTSVSFHAEVVEVVVTHLVPSAVSLLCITK